MLLNDTLLSLKPEVKQSSYCLRTWRHVVLTNISAVMTLLWHADPLYLRLDAVEAPAPKHLAPLHLHLSVVDLILVLHILQLLLGDLLLLCAVTCCLQEPQPAGGDTGHQLRVGQTQTLETTASPPQINRYVLLKYYWDGLQALIFSIDAIRWYLPFSQFQEYLIILQ